MGPAVFPHLHIGVFIMAAPRKNPPNDAAKTIEELAAKGYSNVGLAMEFKVSKDTLKRWLDDYPDLQEAFERGREIERQELHAAVYRAAIAGKGANVNAFFLLKARFGYVEADNKNKVSVDVVVNNVLVVKDHGTDAEWEAKAAAQQRALTEQPSTPRLLEASTAPQADAVASYGPPAFDWQPQPSPTSIYAPEPIPSAPVWRGRA